MLFHDFLDLVKKILEEIHKKDYKYAFQVFFQVLLIFIIVALFKIPFIFIRDISMSIFTITLDSTNFIITHWYEIFEIAYVIVAIFAFVLLFNRRMPKYLDMYMLFLPYYLLLSFHFHKNNKYLYLFPNLYLFYKRILKLISQSNNS